jgi:hypothetical protein
MQQHERRSPARCLAGLHRLRNGEAETYAALLRPLVFFAVAFFAVDFFAVDFLAVAFFTVDFLAVDFLAVAFFAVDFLAVDFLAVDFFAVDFLAAPLFEALFFAALFAPLLLVDLLELFLDALFEADLAEGICRSPLRSESLRRSPGGPSGQCDARDSLRRADTASTRLVQV